MTTMPIFLTEACCPMGCSGLSLEVNEFGTLRCRSEKCPRPPAAAELLANPETEHLVVLAEFGYTIQHPLKERLEGRLFTCSVHAAVSDTAHEHMGEPGRYRLTWGQDGDLEWMFLAGLDADA
jgi:hypothetical protein